MTLGSYRLPSHVEQRITTLLDKSAEDYGETARDRYAALIVQAMQDVADDPFRPGSQPGGVIDRTARFYVAAFLVDDNGFVCAPWSYPLVNLPSGRHLPYDGAVTTRHALSDRKSEGAPMPHAQMPEPVPPPGPPSPPPPYDDPEGPQPTPVELPPPDGETDPNIDPPKPIRLG